MKERLHVHFSDAAIRIGLLHFEGKSREHSVFTYDEDWINNPTGFPISPTMPFRQRTYFTTKDADPQSSAFPGPVSDTIPDAWGRAIVRSDDTAPGRPFNDLDYLMGVDDAARIGALRFKAADGRIVRPAIAGTPNIPPLTVLEALMHASDAVEARTHTQKDVLRLLGNGSSLGGTRPKCNVVDHDGSLAIAKFTSKRDTLAVERAEVATLALARRVGITAAEGRLVEVAGRAIAIIRRFDRRNGQRVPYVSAQTMLGKARADGGSYEGMAEAIRAHCRDPAQQLAELFSRVAFTILVGNTDDHMRNHGFVHAGDGHWSLSPAFDVNPSPDRVRALKTRIAETSSDAASVDLLLRNATLFGVRADAADRTVSEMSTAIAGNWRAFMTQAKMKPREIDAYRDAFDHPETAAARARANTTVARNAAGGRRGSRGRDRIA